MLLALEYLHGQSILYRDVKLENTLVAIDGHVMLADFGVSKRLLGGAVSHSTRTLVGTPDYMAPEQFSGEEYSFEIDFWAFAVMFHEILTSLGIGSRLAPEIAMVGLMTDLSADLLTRMLVTERTQRLGHGDAGVDEVKAHPYFGSVDFAAILRKDFPGPLLDDRAPQGTSPTAPASAAASGEVHVTCDTGSFRYRRGETGSSTSASSQSDGCSANPTASSSPDRPKRD